MDVKDAVAAAKAYLIELLADERISNLGLEEVEFDDGAGVWHVTLGFSRPWDQVGEPFFATTAPNRSYRVCNVRDADGKVLSVKLRDVAQ